MLISETLNHALNEQIRHELGNSHQYIAIAGFFEKECLFGLAKMYDQQSVEEREHATKIVKFVLETGGKLVIPAVPAPQNEFRSVEDAAQVALDSEVRTTNQIYEIVTLATSEKNYIAVNFLQWFVNEQLEEVRVPPRLLLKYALTDLTSGLGPWGGQGSLQSLFLA